MSEMIRIEPLTERTLKEAIDLVNLVFPPQEEPEEQPSVVFAASLNPKKYQSILEQYTVPGLRYWLAIDSNKRVVGTIGLYCYEADKKEAYWLGWFCVASNTRRKGIGTRLLQFAIEETKRSKKSFLRLYTSNHPNELNAHKLYEKYGFRLIKEEPWGDTGLTKLYYELKIQ